MKPTILTVIIAVVTLVVIGGMLGLARMTQSDQDRANAEADVLTAKAMRLLSDYEANLLEIETLRQELGRQLGTKGSPLAVPPQEKEIDAIVREALEDFQAFSKELRESERRSLSSSLEQRLRQLEPEAPDLTNRPKTELGQSESVISQNLKGAIKRIDRLTTENDKLLKEALREVDAALRVQYGQATTQDNINANDLRACILDLQAEVSRSRAMAAWGEALRARLRAGALIDQSSDLLARIRDIESRVPTTLKERLAKEQAELQTRLTQAKARQVGLAAQIDTIKKEIAAAKADAEAGRKALLALENTGFDPKAPADVKRYVDEYAKQAGLVRDANIKADALRYGTLQGVRLDDQQGRDLLKDRYVLEPGIKSATVVKGLTTLESEHASVTKEIGDVEGLLSDVARRVDQLGKVTAALDASRADLAKQKSEIDGRIKALLAQAGKRDEVAAKEETETLSLLDKAEKAYSAAARAGRDRGKEFGTDPAMREIGSDKEIELAMVMGQADAANTKALVHLEQLDSLNEQIAVAKAAVAAGVEGSDQAKIQSLSDDMAKVREESVKAIDVAIKLLSENRAVKGANRNYKWIPQASLAATYQLRSLLTSGAASAEALAAAIQNYEGAVKGREGSPFLKPYVHVLERVREIAAAGGTPMRSTQPSSGASNGSAPDATTPPVKDVGKSAAQRGLVKPAPVAPKKVAPPGAPGR